MAVSADPVRPYALHLGECATVILKFRSPKDYSVFTLTFAFLLIIRSCIDV